MILQKAGLWLAHVDSCSQWQHDLDDDATGQGGQTKQFEKLKTHALFLNIRSTFPFFMKTMKECELAGHWSYGSYGHTLLYIQIMIQIGFYKIDLIIKQASWSYGYCLCQYCLLLGQDSRIMSNKQKIWEQLETVMCLSKNWLRYINLCSFSGHRQWK